MIWSTTCQSKFLPFPTGRFLTGPCLYSLTSGYSRFPIHEKDKPLSFIGFLLVKRLLLYDPSRPKKVGEFKLTVLPEARPGISCFQALDYL